GAPGRRRARASAGTYQWATHRAACRARRRTAPAAPRSTTRGVAGLRPVGAGRASRTCHPASYATSARTARGPARCGTRDHCFLGRARGQQFVATGERAGRARRGRDALAVRAYGIRSTGFGRESPGVKPGRRRDVRFRSSAHRHEHAPVPAPGVEYETAYRLWGRVDEPARRHRTVVAQAESIEASLVGRAAVERRVLVVTQYPHAGRGELALRAGVEVEVEAREVGGPHGRELRTVVRSRTDALDEA